MIRSSNLFIAKDWFFTLLLFGVSRCHWTSLFLILLTCVDITVTKWSTIILWLYCRKNHKVLRSFILTFSKFLNCRIIQLISNYECLNNQRGLKIQSNIIIPKALNINLKHSRWDYKQVYFEWLNIQCRRNIQKWILLV